MKHVLLTVVFLGIACVAMAHELLSPNGNLKLNVVLDSEGGPVYSLYYKGEPVVEPSALGILMEEADLSNGFRILDATNSTFDETWMPVWGEYEKVRNHYNELTVTFSQPAKHDRTMIVRFRLFDDGLGFRYELPEQKTMNYLTVKDELTEFNLTGNHTLYCIPGDYDTNEFAYTTAAISEVREAMERNLRKKGYEAKATSFTVQTPLMIKTTEGLYINIHEAALVDYSAMLLNVDDKVFVSGRISAEEDRASKMILESIRPFSEPKKELWIQFTDVEEFKRREPELLSTIMDSEGSDSVIIYVKKEKMKKVLPMSRNVRVNEELLEKLYREFGEKNVIAVQKRIENTAKMN